LILIIDLGWIAPELGILSPQEDNNLIVAWHSEEETKPWVHSGSPVLDLQFALLAMHPSRPWLQS